MGYSRDLRDRVIDAVEVEDMSRRAAARRFGVSESAAIKWVRRFRRTGKRTPSGTGGHETWAKTNMTRTHGWAPRGERLIAKVPHGKWKTTTFLAALRHDRIKAPRVFDGPINSERFPPKYSPDLNPIEQVFAKLKTLLRKTAPRTADDIRKAIGQLLDSFTPQECANYLKNAGYASA